MGLSGVNTAKNEKPVFCRMHHRHLSSWHSWLIPPCPSPLLLANLHLWSMLKITILFHVKAAGKVVYAYYNICSTLVSWSWKSNNAERSRQERDFSIIKWKCPCACHEITWGNGVIVPLIHNLIDRWVVSFMSQLKYSNIKVHESLSSRSRVVS
jgi:hypothetical protein